MNIWLPHLKEDPKIGKMSTQDLSQLAANIRELAKFEGSDERIDYILNLYEEYRAELSSTAEIPLGQGPSPLKRATDLDLSANTVEDYHVTDLAKQGETRGMFFFADSHASTFHTLQDSANGLVRAIVCFDTHDDLSPMEPLWKGNVFTHLLSAGLIDYLVLIGVADFRIKNTLSRISSEMSSRVLFSTNSIAITAWLKAKQVDEIYLSFDLDVLNTRDERLTSMEYCPFGVLLNVSSSEPGQLDPVKASDFAESCIRPIGKYGPRNLYHLGENGLGTEQALQLVKEIRHKTAISGISRGFSTSRGRLLGDVVELNGPDLGYRTSTFSLSVCQTWKEGAS